MAKQGFSGLAAKLGDAGRKAFEAHKNDEVEIGGGAECPPIPNGVARLVDIHFDEFKSGANQGKLFCYFGATVITPKFSTLPDGSKVPAAGCRTHNTFPLCQTTTTKGVVTTLEANLAKCMNEFKKLGLDLSGMGLDTWEAGAAALVESGPYFGMSVSRSEPTPEFPNPRTWHNWGLAIPDYKDETDPDAGVDEHPDADPEPVKEEKKTPPKTQPQAAGGAKKAPVKGTKPVEDVPFGDDLDMTADKADKGDEKAKGFLTEKARELGYTDEEIENTADWSEVTNMIREKEDPGSDPDTPEAEEEIDYVALGEAADGGDEEAAATITEWGTANGVDVNDHGEKSWAEYVAFVSESLVDGDTEPEKTIPEKGNVYKTKLPGAKKETQVEIMAVFPDKETVNVKCLDTNKAFKGIPFSALVEVS